MVTGVGDVLGRSRGVGIAAVSYTHLDVYKRQGRACVENERNFRIFAQISRKVGRHKKGRGIVEQEK